MGIKVIITKDFAHMSRLAADLVVDKLRGILKDKKEAVLGLATAILRQVCISIWLRRQMMVSSTVVA